MTPTELERLRYPIGPYQPPAEITADTLQSWIDQLASHPAALRQLVGGLNEAQLDTPYRPGGWTIRQVVHHLPDSHLNSYIRMKWALTEDKPLIKAYKEALWAALPDGRQAGVQLSLDLLQALHARWVWWLRAMDPADWLRSYVHPETKQEVRLDRHLGLYAWHCEHHYAHIAQLMKRNGWK